MKDLYKRLKLYGVTDNVDDIRSAIEDCEDADLARTSQFVLLNKGRKKVYDAQHHLLTTLGELRSRFNNPLSPDWESLGNQDFDKDAARGPVDIFELEKAVDLDRQGSKISGGPRLRSMQSNAPDLRWLFFAGAGLLIVGLLVVTITNFVQPRGEVMPGHGYVVTKDDRPANCSVDIRNPGDGHVWVEFSSGGKTALQVLVCERMESTVSIPEGKYSIRFNVGNASDWNGDGFSHQLRIIKKQKGFEVREGRKSVVKIPY
ncbi:MAG: hypothetical protein AAF497_04385 [Planctomycetota bacterium]